MREHTSFYDANSKTVITVSVGNSSRLSKTEGYWKIDSNQVLLGADRWEEWQQLSGDLIAKGAFMAKLEKVSNEKLSLT